VSVNRMKQITWVWGNVTRKKPHKRYGWLNVGMIREKVGNLAFDVRCYETKPTKTVGEEKIEEDWRNWEEPWQSER